MLKLLRRKPEPVEQEIAPLFNWTEIDAGHSVGYPVRAHNSDWRKYTVTKNKHGRWEIRWMMHRMNAIIGWTDTLENGRLFAESHHLDEEVEYAYWI